MVKTIKAIGDAMLNKLVPQAEAGACCDDYGRGWWESCSGGRKRWCTVTCTCGKTCTSCGLP